MEQRVRDPLRCLGLAAMLLTAESALAADETRGAEESAPSVSNRAGDWEKPAAEHEDDLDEVLSYVTRADVVMGVSKEKESLARSPLPVYVVTQEELSRWGARYLQDVVGRTPGFSFYDLEWDGIPRARGQGREFQYGLSIELAPVPDYGKLVLPMRFFNTVEVARGPAGLMWGNAALAGLVNFNLREDLNGPEAMIEYGSFNRTEAAVMTGGRFQKPGDNYFLGVAFAQQDYQTSLRPWDVDSPGKWYTSGWRPSWNITAKLKTHGFKLIFMRTFGDKTLPSANQLINDGTTEFEDATVALTGGLQHEAQDTTVARLEYHLPLDFINDYTRVIEDIDVYLFYNNYAKTWNVESIVVDSQRKHTVGFAATAALFSKSLRFNVGGDMWAQDELFTPSESSAFGEQYGVNWFDNDLPILMVHSRNFYAQLRYSILHNLEILGGIRADGYTGHDVAITPRAGIFYEPIPDLTVKYVFNNSDRQPQATELQAFASNPTLKPERLQAHELSVYWEPGYLTLNATLYYQQLLDALVSDPVVYYANSGGSKTYGVELAISTNAIPNTYLYLNGSALSSRVNASNSQGVPSDTSNRPLLVPQAEGILGAEYTILPWLKAHADVRTVASIPYQTAAGDYQVHNGIAFLDISVRATFLQEHLHLDLYAKNATNNLTRMPAMGPYAELNPFGTIVPEGARFYARLIGNW